MFFWVWGREEGREGGREEEGGRKEGREGRCAV
jgi:hypothetical protein